MRQLENPAVPEGASVLAGFRHGRQGFGCRVLERGGSLNSSFRDDFPRQHVSFMILTQNPDLERYPCADQLRRGQFRDP